MERMVIRLGFLLNYRDVGSRSPAGRILAHSTSSWVRSIQSIANGWC